MTVRGGMVTQVGRMGNRGGGVDENWSLSIWERWEGGRNLDGGQGDAGKAVLGKIWTRVGRG